MLLKDLVLNRPGTAVRSMHPPGVSTTTTLYAFKYCIKPYSFLMLCAFKYCTNPRRILKLIFCTACTELSEEVKVQGINHALMAILCPVGSYRDQEVAIYGGLLQLLQHQRIDRKRKKHPSEIILMLQQLQQPTINCDFLISI